MTFVTTMGSFSYRRLPFGLATAGALFQRYMNACLEKWLWRVAVALVYDVAIGTNSAEEHTVVLTNIVATLARRGFSVKAEKMNVFAKDFIFLGHLSTPTGLRATDRMVEAISKMPTPNSAGKDPKKQVKSFLGMASYIRKFIKGYAKVAKPLTELTETGKKFEWTDECDQAWKEIVRLIAEKKVCGQWIMVNQCMSEQMLVVRD